MRRVSAFEIRHFDEIIDYLEPDSLLGSDLPKDFKRAWNAATASSFQHLDGHSARA
jgi:hypothetical protein